MFTADQRYLLGGGADHRLHRWEIGNNLRSETYPLPTNFQENSLESVAANAPHSLLAAGDDEGQVFLWRADETGQPPFRIVQPEGLSSVEHLSLHPVDSVLIAGNDEGIGLYDFAGNVLVAPGTFGYAEIQDVGFSGDGSQLLIAAERAVHLWRMEPDTAFFVTSF